MLRYYLLEFSPYFLRQAFLDKPLAVLFQELLIQNLHSVVP